MDSPIYTEVRGANVFTEEELRKALRAYSRHFEERDAPEDDHQYLLFRPRVPYLLIVNFFPKGHPYLEPNIIITLTSNRADLSERIVERFEKLADLALLTKHECHRLGEFTNENEEDAFRDYEEISKRKKAMLVKN